VVRMRRSLWADRRSRPGPRGRIARRSGPASVHLVWPRGPRPLWPLAEVVVNRSCVGAGRYASCVAMRAASRCGARLSALNVRGEAPRRGRRAGGFARRHRAARPAVATRTCDGWGRSDPIRALWRSTPLRRCSVRCPRSPRSSTRHRPSRWRRSPAVRRSAHSSHRPARGWRRRRWPPAAAARRRSLAAPRPDAHDRSARLLLGWLLGRVPGRIPVGVRGLVLPFGDGEV